MVFAVAGLSPGAGAATTGTHNNPAPSNNIQQARNPGHLPGAAPIGNCVTGPSLCIDYRLGCSLSHFRIPVNRRPDAQNGNFPLGNAVPATAMSDTLLQKVLNMRSITSCPEDYGFVIITSGDAHHIRRMGSLRAWISCPKVTWIPGNEQISEPHEEVQQLSHLLCLPRSREHRE